MADFSERKKRFSVIIPALDEEKLIERLLKQFNHEIKSEFDLEVIVSDGGSKDLTLKISDQYSDKIIFKKEDTQQNISQGRNEGAKNSQGDVLIFLNADTYVRNIKYFLKEINNQFTDKQIAAIACRIEVFPEEKKFSDKIFHFMYNNYVAVLNKFFIGMGRGECHIIQRNRFFETGGYNESLAAGEDFDLYKRLRHLGKIVFRKDLIIYESPRRYRKFGYVKVFWDWTKNSVSVMMFNKSISKKWEAVR